MELILGQILNDVARLRHQPYTGHPTIWDGSNRLT